MNTPSKEIFRKYTDDETFAKIVSYETISQMWKHCLEEYSEQPAIYDKGEYYSYSEIEEKVAKLRTVVLNAVGDNKGASIGLLAPNGLDFVVGLLAVTTLGYQAVVLPVQLDEGTIFGCSMKFGMKALVFDPSMEGKLNVVKAQNPNLPLVGTDEGSNEKTEMKEDFDGVCPCVTMFTGGTTGRSKGAVLSNRAVMTGVKNGCYGVKEVFGLRYILVLPLSHVFGLIRTLLTCLYTGGTLCICRDNKDMFKDCAIFRPNLLVAVPALAEMALLLSKKFGKNMLGEDMKYIIAGAATVAPYLVSEYEKYGIELLPGYGLTESANLVSGNPEAKTKPESVGIMYPDQEYKIVDGELWIKGNNMMDGYVGEDIEAFEDGYFKTGDLVRFDDEGFLYITGRIKEIIVLDNGENVSPAEVETVFNELKFVQDSQLYEDVADNGKHFLALEVVLREPEVAALGMENPKEFIMKELEKINASLPDYQRAMKIIIRDTDFKRTPSMKIERYHKC